MPPNLWYFWSSGVDKGASAATEDAGDEAIAEKRTP